MFSERHQTQDRMIPSLHKSGQERLTIVAHVIGKMSFKKDAGASWQHGSDPRDRGGTMREYIQGISGGLAAVSLHQL